ncbi:hypothetical protein F3Y22_tig00002840pilonHSYRG01138 [Hibiscus syriacus]|uniref:ZF-HD dimerization-type domain-containing protein n=1 Tax=Hibiscus syriacus TaxID=106335 RepID=A0A6A3CSC6_HIBSY|nr:hypothetical protein F3Y22_tig00002840pilonHSYRG01138 [Hibiscus syriacus]
MEVRGEEDDIKTPVRDEIHNGAAVLTCTQTLDHVHGPQRQQHSFGHTGRSPASPGVVRYRECLKNHAASIGGNVYDGCGEFMPSGEEGTLEALKCAACDCHRNFHLKEADGETRQFGGNHSGRSSLMLSPLQLPPPLPSPTMLHHHQKYSVHTSPHSAMIAPMNVSFGGGGGAESSSEELNMYRSNPEGMPSAPSYVLSKKRYRTKFTQEQKDKMLELAEKMGCGESTNNTKTKWRSFAPSTALKGRFSRSGCITTRT